MFVGLVTSSLLPPSQLGCHFDRSRPVPLNSSSNINAAGSGVIVTVPVDRLMLAPAACCSFTDNVFVDPPTDPDTIAMLTVPPSEPAFSFNVPDLGAT